MGFIYLFILAVLVMANFATAVHLKRDSPLAVALVAAIWVVYAGNTDNPDYEGYARQYDNSRQLGLTISDTSMEPGFRVLMSISSGLGLSYQVFVAAIAACGLLLIHATVRKVPGGANFVYPLYFAYPLLFDVVQTRNFLALSLIIYGLGHLVAQKRWGRPWFLACVFLATTFHFSAAIYAALALVPRLRDKRLGTWPIAIGVAGMGLTILLPGAGLTISTLLEQATGNYDFRAYFETRARLGFLVPFFFQCLGLALLNYAHAAVHRSSLDVADASAQRWVTAALNLCILSFLFLPLYAYSSNFWRIARNVHIVYYLAFFVAQRAMAGNPAVRTPFIAGVVLYTLGLLLLYSDLELLGTLLSNNILTRI